MNETGETTMELNELQTEMQKTWSAFKDRNDLIEAEVKKYGTATQEAQNILNKVGDRLDSIETKMNRPGVGPSASKDEEIVAQEKYDLNRYLRKGIFPESRKAAGDPFFSTTTAGGYTIVQQYIKELILTTLTEMNPIRQYARVLQTGTNSVRIPTRVALTSINLAADEITTERTSTETATPFSYKDITVYEYYAMVDISRDLLEDSEFDLEAEIRSDIAEQLAYQEGKDFITGTTPVGILLSPPGGNCTGTGTSANWPATNPGDKIWDVYFALKEPYASRGAWALARATLGSIRKFKTSDGAYLWSPGFGSVPNSICGAPYFLCKDWNVAGASKYIMAFADWKKAYVIVDRIGMSIVRDDLTRATYNTVRYIARYRVGGSPLVAEAIQFLQCGA
jgi:HK97 family phage major capsid protein